jgi:predicted phage terminase large subunit-like protein
MSNLKASRKALEEWKAYEQLCQDIHDNTPIDTNESADEKAKRIAKLKGNFSEFCKYYFPNYTTAEFGWFHLKAIRWIVKNKEGWLGLEWPRAHAKSIFADLLVPMYLLANDWLKGMVIASANEDAAKKLLSDVQAELSSNQRFNADFGSQQCLGKWTDGQFATSKGIGFWAFGRGQKPRGIHEGHRRPNYFVVDDIDDDEIVHNPDRVAKAVDWVIGGLFGASDPAFPSLKVIVQNRWHGQGIFAHLMGDITAKTPLRKTVYRIKVYATEDKNHNMLEIDAGGKPAWKERYTNELLKKVFDPWGPRLTLREFYHQHIVEGKIFKAEWISYTKALKPRDYDKLVTYCDPSFGDSKKNDYKAIVLVGVKDTRYHILKVWLRQASVTAMAAAHYDIHEATKEATCNHYMESNFVQYLLLDEYEKEGLARGYQLRIRGDDQKKDKKEARIENLSPLFERGYIQFDERLKADEDTQLLIQQFMNFPTGHDDGPDAVEGAISKMPPKSRKELSRMTAGNYHKSTAYNL